ncbi:hypothetical protein Tco_1105128 [Tanacetum coccineum]
MSTPVTVEEKTKKKNDVKARGLLLMALRNEHQLTFSQYPDAKSRSADHTNKASVSSVNQGIPPRKQGNNEILKGQCLKKDLDQLLGTVTIIDKSKKGFGYSAVPPPHPLIYNRPNKLVLSYFGLDEFKEPEFKGSGLENSKKESNVICENQSDNSKENSNKSLVKEQVSQVKISFVEGCGSNTSKSVSKVEPKDFRKNNDAPIIEDWVSDDEEQDESKTKPEKKNVIPTATKIEKPIKKSVRPRIVNTTRLYRTPINTIRPRVVNTARPNRTSVNAARANRYKYNDAGRQIQSQFDEGYVAFRRGAYGGKISGKRTLKTDNLDFEDVYFVNELKFNLFSVSQMCDKKNYVLFTNTECLILSPNFKLLDENQILLKIPRKENTVQFDMKNLFPKRKFELSCSKARCYSYPRCLSCPLLI